MNRKVIYSIAALVVAAGVGVGVITAGAGTDPSNPGTPVSPQEKLDSVVDQTMSQFEGATVKIAGPNENDVFYARSADFAAMVRASNAKGLNLDYDASDLLAPVSDKNGKKVGYFAEGAGFIPSDVAEAPDFDLCSLVKERTVKKSMLPDGTWIVQDPC